MKDFVTAQMERWQWGVMVKEDDSEKEIYRPNLSWSDVSKLLASGKIDLDTSLTWMGLSGNGTNLRHLRDSDFLCEDFGRIIPIPSEASLHMMISEGRITCNTRIWSKKLPAGGILIKELNQLNLSFSPPVVEFIKNRSGKWLTVVSGANNSGKSLLLKFLHNEIGEKCMLLSCNRFYHFSDLSYASEGFNLTQHYLSSVQNLYQKANNNEQSSYPLQQVISDLPDARRDKLFEICSEQFGESFEIFPRRPDTKMTQYYIAVGSVELSQCSSGTRLFLLLLAALMSAHHKTILIDEPELGLSPILQRKLASLLFDEERRRELFPDIESIFLVTHSHHFLDRKKLGVNFSVSKEKNVISLFQIDEVSALHDLTLKMLGEDLSALFLPQAILLVEGPSDQTFLRKIISDRFPASNVSVVNCGGDGKISIFFNQLITLFPDFHQSPYRMRTLVIYDKSNSAKVASFTRAGLPTSNIIVLDKNGIEYYYSKELLSNIFGLGNVTDIQIELSDEKVTIGGTTKKKIDLATDIVARMGASYQLDEEFSTKVISSVERILGDSKPR